MKDYLITCTMGSLEGGGNTTSMVQHWEANNEDHARSLFKDDRENQMYGRRIINVREG
ncbi:MAG: hypothetical protein KA369_08510 [Spirochaetes bacterium]|nr:hypothetical protein [Spirochaetota bacterium]